MDADAIRGLVADLDTRRTLEEDAAWLKLRPLGAGVVPYLAEAYRAFRTWQGRASLVYHSVRFARTEEEAYRLGLAATQDRSWVVRHQACTLLAYALRRDAIPALEELIDSQDERTIADARAAIDAIEHQNHHLFLDRQHTGKVFLGITPPEADD